MDRTISFIADFSRSKCWSVSSKVWSRAGSCFMSRIFLVSDWMRLRSVFRSAATSSNPSQIERSRPAMSKSVPREKARILSRV